MFFFAETSVIRRQRDFVETSSLKSYALAAWRVVVILTPATRVHVAGLEVGRNGVAGALKI